MAMELILGQMIEYFKETGKTIKCMVRVFSLGLMVVNMKVNIKMTRNGDMVYLRGLMGVSTKEIGFKVNNTEKGYTHQIMVLKEKVCGIAASVSSISSEISLI